MHLQHKIMKFSIITCTYNSEAYVQKNIDSVKNQTFQDFEHVFIDGFSTDGTIDIIKKYQQEFPEKVSLFQYPTKGIGNAMNKGIEHSSGKYVNHMHSDDSFFNENVLSDVSDFINKNNSPDWIYGKAKFTNTEKGGSRIIPHRKIYRKIRFWLLLLTNYIPHQSVFIKKEVFEKYGKFNERYKNSMDYEMWLKLSKNKIESKFIDKIICNFSIRKNAQSSFSDNAMEENLEIQKNIIKRKFLYYFIYLVNKINFKRNF